MELLDIRTGEELLAAAESVQNADDRASFNQALVALWKQLPDIVFSFLDRNNVPPKLRANNIPYQNSLWWDHLSPYDAECTFTPQNDGRTANPTLAFAKLKEHLQQNVNNANKADMLQYDMFGQGSNRFGHLKIFDVNVFTS